MSNQFQLGTNGLTVIDARLAAGNGSDEWKQGSSNDKELVMMDKMPEDAVHIVANVAVVAAVNIGSVEAVCGVDGDGNVGVASSMIMRESEIALV